ncbi:hypothetical protein KAI78_09190 [bacterium]|nr:hypothetical protein [bacterium]
MASKRNILRKLSRNKISVSDAQTALSSCDGKRAYYVLKTNFLRVKIKTDSGPKNVRLNFLIPLGLVRLALPLINKKLLKKAKIPNLGISVSDLHISSLLDDLRHFGRFSLVEVHDENTHVNISFK